jgi:hypothetical protein
MDKEIRQTSIDAYHQVVESGYLGVMQMKAYDGLHQLGTATSHELDAFLSKPGETRPGYHKRLSELKRMGLVSDTTRRICRITKREAIEWRLTDRVPTGKLKNVRMPSADALLAAASVLNFEQHGDVVEWLRYRAGQR